MKIEILYPEFTNIYGDSANIKFLKKNFKESEIILTNNGDEPYFVKNKVDMIYMGSHPDEYENRIIECLTPYKDRLKELIENDTVFMFTGNAIEVLLDYVEFNNKKVPMLGIFKELHAIRNRDVRYNTLFLGKYEDLEIVGNQSQIAFIYGENKNPFIEGIDGSIGLNKDTNMEGIHYKNLFATTLLGPFLILNPKFTKYLFSLFGYKKELIFEKQLLKTYENRLEILKNMKDKYIGFE